MSEGSSITGLTDVWDSKKFKPLEVFINPSRSVLKEIAPHVRCVIDDKSKTLYAWDGTSALHYDVWKNILKKELKDKRKYDDVTLRRSNYEHGDRYPDPNR
jgi:hypothetical protein